MARQDKRQQIMQAAEKLFTTRRFHEITLDDVAQAAHVGKGTIYRHFKDKDDLFFQVAASGSDDLCALVRAEADKAAPFEDQLLSACRSISAFFARRSQLFRMMQSEDARMRPCKGRSHEQWNARRKKLVMALSTIVAKGVEEAKVRDDVPPDVLARFLLGMLRTRARYLDDVPEPMRSHELVVDLFCGGAGRDAAVATTKGKRI